MSTGIPQRTALYLVRQFGPDRCQQKLALMERQENLRSRGGWLFRAIVDDFQPAQGQGRAERSRVTTEEVEAIYAARERKQQERDAFVRQRLAEWRAQGWKPGMPPPGVEL